MYDFYDLKPMTHVVYIFTKWQTELIAGHCLETSRGLSKTITFFKRHLHGYYQSCFDWFIGFAAYDIRYLYILSNVERQL